MRSLDELFANNRQWAKSMLQSDPDFFDRLQHQQSPELLWIGCSDSRVPANQIAGVLPGSIFVQRNIANIVDHDDKNCMAVLQFAVEVLKVRHVLVVGHYRCGGVGAVLENRSLGPVSEWLWPVQAVHDRFRADMEDIPVANRWDALCELNVVDQAHSVAETAIVRKAWAQGQELWIHGWIYGVHDGLLRDLKVTVQNEDEMAVAVEQAFTAVLDRWRMRRVSQHA